MCYREMLALVISLIAGVALAAPDIQLDRNAVSKNAANAVRKQVSAPVLALEMSGFRIDHSGDKTYWFVDLENRSDLTANKNDLEIQAYQVDSRNARQEAGAVIINTMPLRPRGKLHLQREFPPVEGLKQIVIEVRDRNRKRRLAMQRFDAGMRASMPLTQTQEFSPVFSGKLSAQIKADQQNYLWYLEIRNVGNGELRLADYDFRVSPSIRGIRYGQEPYTDVATLYQQVLQPNKTFRIYLATGHDSCFAGDLIDIGIRNKETGQVVNLLQPVDTPLYRKNSDVLENKLRFYDMDVRIPLKESGFPPYFNPTRQRFYVRMTTWYGDRGVVAVRVDHLDDSLDIPLPNGLQFKNFKKISLNVEVYENFCGREVLIKKGGMFYEGANLVNMEPGSKINY